MIGLMLMHQNLTKVTDIVIHTRKGYIGFFISGFDTETNNFDIRKLNSQPERTPLEDATFVIDIIGDKLRDERQNVEMPTFDIGKCTQYAIKVHFNNITNGFSYTIES
ncbi:hypothetical protein Ddc_12183 [Ditylenchus destructor]|nr:hypothetical protein Ddc_12183 [Ditylenchus destructor]